MEKVDVEARARKARELFMSGYNCSQSVFLAYADLYGIDPKLASTIVAPLGGGSVRGCCASLKLHGNGTPRHTVISDFFMLRM